MAYGRYQSDENHDYTKKKKKKTAPDLTNFNSYLRNTNSSHKFTDYQKIP